MELDLSTFFGLLLALAFVGAGLSVFLDRRRERAAAKAIRAEIIRCRVCASAYAAPQGRGAKPCPVCGRENARGRDRRLG